MPEVIWEGTKNPAPTTILAACLREVLETSILTFPVIAIPFGADETTNCRFFGSVGEISEDHFEDLLVDAYPMRDGIQRVHFISWHILESSTSLPPKFLFFRT
jgi:hypothetical protein